MKRNTLIIALIIVALVAGNVFAAPKAPPAGDPTVVLVNLDTSFMKDGKLLDDKDIAMGRGWIVGDQFKQVMDAKAGSYIRLTVTGTANLNWNSIGAVGIKKVENDAKRIEFKPKSGGTYTVDIPIDALRKKIKGEKEAIGINIWGDHVINKVELYLN